MIFNECFDSRTEIYLSCLLLSKINHLHLFLYRSKRLRRSEKCSIVFCSEYQRLTNTIRDACSNLVMEINQPARKSAQVAQELSENLNPGRISGLEK